MVSQRFLHLTTVQLTLSCASTDGLYEEETDEKQASEKGAVWEVPPSQRPLESQAVLLLSCLYTFTWQDLMTFCSIFKD